MGADGVCFGNSNLDSVMVKIEFLQDYKCCWKKGDTGDVLEHFAQVLIEQGIAKQIEGPPKHKMVESAPKAKGHNISGYVG